MRYLYAISILFSAFVAKSSAWNHNLLFSLRSSTRGRAFTCTKTCAMTHAGEGLGSGRIAFFPSVTGAWRDVTTFEQNELPAKEFLEAASKFIPIFGNFLLLILKCCFIIQLNAPDRLGPVFKPVKGDVGGNIEKLRKHSALHPHKRTIRELVLSEIGTKKLDSGSAAAALLWYHRCL